MKVIAKKGSRWAFNPHLTGWKTSKGLKQGKGLWGMSALSREICAILCDREAMVMRKNWGHTTDFGQDKIR